MFVAHRALLRLHDALAKSDNEGLLQAMRAPQIMLREVEADNIQFYRDQLTKMWDVKKVRISTIYIYIYIYIYNFI